MFDLLERVVSIRTLNIVRVSVVRMRINIVLIMVVVVVVPS